jgi:hypothetical protein
MLRRIGFQSDDLRVTHRITANIMAATTKRQKAIEKTLTPVMRFMKIAAVPKRVPATMPSRMASFRLRSTITCAFAASILLGEKGWKTLKDFGINDARCKFRAFASFRKS